MANFLKKAKGSNAYLGYNMLDAGIIMKELKKNPSKEYHTLKKMSHKSLMDGKKAIGNNDLKKANHNFAFSYQLRCACDYIWKKVLNNSGDIGHAKYLAVQREFGKYATGKVKTNEQKKLVLSLISKIHD